MNLADTHLSIFPSEKRHSTGSINRFMFYLEHHHNLRIRAKSARKHRALLLVLNLTYVRVFPDPSEHREYARKLQLELECECYICTFVLAREGNSGKVNLIIRDVVNLKARAVNIGKKFRRTNHGVALKSSHSKWVQIEYIVFREKENVLYISTK